MRSHSSSCCCRRSPAWSPLWSSTPTGWRSWPRQGSRSPPSIALIAFTGLRDRGVALIAEVPQGIPLPGVPSLHDVADLLPGALAISVMAFLETVAVARGVRRSTEPQIDSDRELLAGGFASVAGSFFHSLPPAGGFSQTAVALRAGARTQLSGIVTAVLAVLVALFLAPVLSDLPQATLGAMVVVATLGLVDLGSFV
ncbi:hypothetical protein GS860_05385, partial [Rhodococcus hoagii]|nr:hypothetical protein [Prescottella equi]